MKNNSDEKARAIDVTDVQRAVNDIPIEMIEKFPEYKVIIEMVNQMTNERYVLKEIEKKVMQSEEYQRLEKIQDEINKFQNKLEGIDLEKDLKDAEWSQKYTARMQNAANKVYMNMELKTKNEGIDENLETVGSNPVHWFEDIGYIITEKQLAVELAKIGKLIYLKSAFHVLDLLALLAGVTIFSRTDDKNILTSIIEKEDILRNYIDEFDKKYKVR